MSMCSFFSQKMEKDEGDLADVVRASGVGGVSGRGGCSSANNQAVEWQIPSQQQLHHQYQHVDTDVDVDLDLDLDLDVDVDVDFPSEPPPQAPAPPVMDNFGDPFCSIQDPLLHDIDLPDSSTFFDGSHLQSKMNIVQDHNTLLGGGNLLGGQTIFDEEMRRPSNIFSRMLQISPNSNMSISPCIITASPRAGGGVVKTSSSSSSSSSLVCNDLILRPDISTGCSSLDNQISSPRNPGIKRRKSQAKKVVCIPAPSAANNRPAGGEVVPSDLWAWRKYGQKPIKGSPYPRGYYRCSSSKGCSARKQVERSRTDPNMLVITYTSEHNHPWPTQRNALAGSTRSQPSKGNSNNSASKTSQNRSTQNSCYTMDEEQKDKTNDNGCIKEEMGVFRDKPADGVGSVDHQNNYKPQFPPKPNQTDDFFAELGELEPSHLFTTTQGGFTGGEERSNEGERDNNKALDPFSLFDWRS